MQLVHIYFLEGNPDWDGENLDWIHTTYIYTRIVLHRYSLTFPQLYC